MKHARPRRHGSRFPWWRCGSMYLLVLDIWTVQRAAVWSYGVGVCTRSRWHRGEHRPAAPLMATAARGMLAGPDHRDLDPADPVMAELLRTRTRHQAEQVFDETKRMLEDRP